MEQHGKTKLHSLKAATLCHPLLIQHSYKTCSGMNWVAATRSNMLIFSFSSVSVHVTTMMEWYKIIFQLFLLLSDNRLLKFL